MTQKFATNGHNANIQKTW